MDRRAPSVVQVLDRHIFQTDYPDKDAVLQQMATTAYVDVMSVSHGEHSAVEDVGSHFSEKIPFSYLTNNLNASVGLLSKHFNSIVIH